MPAHPVTVTASYDARRAPADTSARLRSWSLAGDGRTFTVDGSIAPVRWTVTADYVIDAENAHEAERAAVERFVADSAAAGIVAPETVVAASGPLS